MDRDAGFDALPEGRGDELRRLGAMIGALCVFHADGNGHLPARDATRLRKANDGRSCVRIERVDDVDDEVLREMLAEAGRLGAAARG